MADATGIQWTDSSWNPVRGCSRVSAGCEQCYAMHTAHRFSGPRKPYEGLTTIRNGKVDWKGVARFHPEMLDQPLRWERPRRIFVNSMSDLFHESLSNEEIAAVFGVMAVCPQHTFQVLTKRPKRMKDWFEWVERNPEFMNRFLHPTLATIAATLVDAAGHTKNADRIFKAANRVAGKRVWPLPNVHIGVTAENQEAADERIPLLLQVPAAVRFVSAEPLLGPISFEETDNGETVLAPECWGDCACPADSGCRKQGGDGVLTRRIDWVIVGGESGPGARPCNIEWIRSIVEQCKSASVPVFVKQLGSKIEGAMNPETVRLWGGPVLNLDWRERVKNKKGADPSEWSPDLRVREFPNV